MIDPEKWLAQKAQKAVAHEHRTGDYTEPQRAIMHVLHYAGEGTALRESLVSLLRQYEKDVSAAP